MKTIIAFLIFILLSPKNYAAEEAKGQEIEPLNKIVSFLNIRYNKFIHIGSNSCAIAQGWKIDVSSVVNLGYGKNNEDCISHTCF